MKTKAIVIVVILCGLLSSPVFAVGGLYIYSGGPGDWNEAGKWIALPPPNAPPGDDEDAVFIASSCIFNIPAETIGVLFSDHSIGDGTLTVGSDTVLTVLGNVTIGYFLGGTPSDKINIAGGTVKVMGDGQSRTIELEFVDDGPGVQINVTDGGLLELHGPENRVSGESIIIRYRPDSGAVLSTITVSGTTAGSGVGVIEFHPRDGYIPTISHGDAGDQDILLIGEGHIKYVGCNAMAQIANNADNDGSTWGIFQGDLDGSEQMYTPFDVNTPGKDYGQNADNSVAWFYDNNDTYLFSAVGMTLIDAGPSLPRYWQEGEEGASILMNGTLTKAVNDANDYTYMWTCVPSEGVTFENDDPTVEDPNVFFPSLGIYTLQITATRTTNGPYVITDFVTIDVTIHKKVMVTHLAIDAGELDAEHFADSSTEGDRHNHAMITDDAGSGWSDIDGVVGCGDNDALYADDDKSIELHLNHAVVDFNDLAPHLDNIDIAVTVALWFKGEDNENQYILEKVGSFRLYIDRQGDLRSGIWPVGKDDYQETKSRTNDLGKDLANGGLEVNSDQGGSDGGDHDQWHHLAISYDSLNGVVRHYVDGVKTVDDNDELGISVIPSLADRRIATYPGETKLLVLGDEFEADKNQDFRRAGLDDIRIYNYVLEDYEIAGLASMGESVAMVDAGSSVTFDPNVVTWDPNFPPNIQLDGAYAKLGRGITSISNDDDDNKIMWEQESGPGTATFTNSNDPETTVRFSEPGVYRLRLNSFERLCGSSNDHFDGMTVTVLPAATCAQVKSNGWNYAADLDGDCDVDGDDLRLMAERWLDVVPDP